MTTPFTSDAVRAAGGRWGSAQTANPDGDHSDLESAFLYHSAGWELSKVRKRCPHGVLTDDQVDRLLEVLR